MAEIPQNTSREFLMTDQNFQDISEFAHRYTGIVLGEHKRDLVYGRLARRLRALKLKDFSTYCKLIDSPDSEEISHFINAITTNLTSFFRENHHFEFLKNQVLSDIKKYKTNKRIRIWSAGCSTGEEPYSIALVLNEVMNQKGWDCKVLATDLDSNVLNHGFKGEYEASRIESLSADRKQKWFLRNAKSPDLVKVKPSLQALVTFKRLNLLEPWPMKGGFDSIFCRNVVIYFNKETQKQLFNRFADMLLPGGYLFIGHSESLHHVSDRFKLLGQTTYQKI
jgi:chemotaxis protein methyltransferase CheR